MRPILKRFLTQRYQRDILHGSVQITPMVSSQDLVDEIKAEIARIDALKLGANLAQRDFVSYQTRRALVELLAQLETTATLSVTEANKDKATITGTRT
jgi:hypothetical protein